MRLMVSIMRNIISHIQIEYGEHSAESIPQNIVTELNNVMLGLSKPLHYVRMLKVSTLHILT